MANYNLNSIESTEKLVGNTMHVEIKTIDKKSKCPICGSSNIIKNGFKTKRVRHNTDVFIDYIFNIKITRYHCKHCGGLFFEDEYFSFNGGHLSIETVFGALKSFKEISSTFSSVARLFRITNTEMVYLFDNYVSEPTHKPELPEVISFDEKFLNRTVAENGYSFVMIDWLNIKILDLIPSRHINKLSTYFSGLSLESRKKVKYITMDMNETYKRCAEIYFSWATIAVDSFHVLQNLIRAFEKVRHKFLRKYDNGADILENNELEYYLLKKGNKILIKMYGNLDQTKKYNRKLKYRVSDRNLVDMILKIDPEIEKAYNLMQSYLEFNYKTSYGQACKEIDELIDSFINSKINSMIDFGYTLKSWKKYILNSFIKIYDNRSKKYRRLSDGPIEGINSKISKIHMNSNGYRSCTRLRKTIIYKVNKYLPFKLTKN